MLSADRSSVARVYDRVARFYDWYEAPMDRMGGRAKRERVIGRARGRVLEIGIGTGRNLEFYPDDVALTGIDISEEMLRRARSRAEALGRDVELQQADAEALPFPDQSFDTVTATCVFCSVADPVQGLSEARRVVKPHGEVRLLEHVRPDHPVLGKLADWLSPITRRVFGPELNRRTEDNVRAAGLYILTVRGDGIWREIVARPISSNGGNAPSRVQTPRQARRPHSVVALPLAPLFLIASCDTDAMQRSLARRATEADTTVVVHSRAPAADAFREAVQAALPGLVFVQVEGLPTALRGWPGLGPGANPFGGQGDRSVPVGSGSGFILDSSGLVLTNNHVVREAAAVTVVLRDNRRFEASVVGRDPDTDIAVLRIQAEGLTPARLGDSDSIQVGDWVLALGYPLGLSATVTAGIVSGTGRSLGVIAEEAAAPLEHFIQTDAAINPGNSGGPMVDLAGRVVGVNSAIASPTGYYTGYGFAVPINLARRVADDLIRFGDVRRPALGVRIADVTPADAQVFGLHTIAGAVIVGIVAGSPAARAGIELGDVIVRVDSEAIGSAGDLQSALARRRPGDRVTLRTVRDGDSLDVAVELATLPSRAPRPQPEPATHTGPARLGFAVVEERGAVIVADVDRFSPAARAGVRPGQRVVALNRATVRTLQDFRAVLEQVGPPGVLSLRVEDPAAGETIINFDPDPLHRGRR